MDTTDANSSPVSSRARARHVRMSPTKVRRVVDLVRGMPTSEALGLLQYAPQSASEPVAKLIASAVANARLQKPSVEPETLYISKATVDKGPNSHMRRWRPRAMGRATRITKGLSHLTIELSER